MAQWSLLVRHAERVLLRDRIAVGPGVDDDLQFVCSCLPPSLVRGDMVAGLRSGHPPRRRRRAKLTHFAAPDESPRRAQTGVGYSSSPEPSTYAGCRSRRAISTLGDPERDERGESMRDARWPTAGDGWYRCCAAARWPAARCSSRCRSRRRSSSGWRCCRPSGLPLARPVTVYWDDHQIPFIDAETRRRRRVRARPRARPSAAGADGDLPAHRAGTHRRDGRAARHRHRPRHPHPRLRPRHAGDPGGDAGGDAALAAAVRRRRQPLSGDDAKRLPFEYADPRACSASRGRVADVLTFGRLAGADVTWIVWFNLLKLRDRPDWPQIWARLLDEGGDRSLPPPGATGRDGRHGRHARRAEPVRQQQPRHRAQPHAHRRGHPRQRSAPRHQPAEHLAARRPEVAVLPRRRPDGAGPAAVRHRPQSVDRLGRHQHAGERQRPDRRLRRCRRPRRATRDETIGVRWWLDEEVDGARDPLRPDPLRRAATAGPAACRRWRCAGPAISRATR